MRSGEALSECFRADLLTCLFMVTSSSSSSDRSPSFSQAFLSPYYCQEVMCSTTLS